MFDFLQTTTLPKKQSGACPSDNSWASELELREIRGYASDKQQSHGTAGEWGLVQQWRREALRGWETADTALLTADTALLTADTALMTADTALLTADTALLTADTAQRW